MILNARSQYRIRHTVIAQVLAIVAAGSVGFAVGDVLATPVPNAATITTTWPAERTKTENSKTALEWSWRLAPGRTIEIKGVHGSITAEASGGDRVEVTARKRWRRSDPDEVRIEVIEHEDGVTLCVVYPTPPGEEPNTCVPGEGGRSSTRNNDVSVDFQVRVPRGVNLSANTVNGNLELGRIAGQVEAHTVNGSIHLAAGEQASATTVNGSITATLGARRWTDAIEFTTVNGQITLELPEGVDADVDARTMNGSISSDFPLELSGRLNRRMRGTIGEGGGGLDLSTLNGSIRLLKAR